MIIKTLNDHSLYILCYLNWKFNSSWNYTNLVCLHCELSKGAFNVECPEIWNNQKITIWIVKALLFHRFISWENIYDDSLLEWRFPRSYDWNCTLNKIFFLSFLHIWDCFPSHLIWLAFCILFLEKRINEFIVIFWRLKLPLDSRRSNLIKPTSLIFRPFCSKGCAWELFCI